MLGYAAHAVFMAFDIRDAILSGEPLHIGGIVIDCFEKQEDGEGEGNEQI